jgi:uncharacterized RDD family membrane protein YckC
MKTKALSLICVAIACFGRPAWGQSASRDLLAHGGEDYFWVARVLPVIPQVPFESTDLRYREDFGGPWRFLQNVSARVVSITSRGGELLLVLQNGQWMIADETNIRIGPPPPRSGKMVAIAAEQDVVWAVVMNQEPTTRSTSEPAIMAAVDRWRVYQFGPGNWINPHKLPDIGDQNFDALSLAVVNQLPTIAWRRGAAAIYISHMDSGGNWSKPIVIIPPQRSPDFKLLSVQGHAVLWTAAPPNSPESQIGGELHEGDDFSHTVDLAYPDKAPPATAAQTIAMFKERWRWLASTVTTTEEDYYEQDYELNGKITPAYTPGADDQNGPHIPITSFLIGAATVVLISALAAIAQRRANGLPTPIPTDEVLRYISPLGVRSAAAVIDLVPTLAVLWSIPRSALVNPIPQDIPDITPIIWIALGTYVLHTMVAELICEQSVGKMMFGLHVAGSFGGKPSVMGIIVRNLLRPVDLFPLVSFMAVILSPRWQRVGDLTGRTVVVTDQPQEIDDSDDSED